MSLFTVIPFSSTIILSLPMVVWMSRGNGSLKFNSFIEYSVAAGLFDTYIKLLVVRKYKSNTGFRLIPEALVNTSSMSSVLIRLS